MRGDIGITLSAMPTQSNDVSHCQCGGWVWFTTDTIGRTVENCDGCAYRGPQRTQSTKIPKTPSSQRRKDRLARVCTRVGCNKLMKARGQFYCSRACAGIASAPERGNQLRGKPARRGFPNPLMVGKNDPNRDDAA